MHQLTPWLVLVLLGIIPAQALQARSVSSPMVASVEHRADLRSDAGQIDLSLTAIHQTEQVTPTLRAPQPTISAPLGAVTRTVFAQATSPLSVTVAVTNTTPLTASTAPTASTPATMTAPVTTTTTAISVPDGPIQGTIIANRTQSAVRYFVEGQTYELDPLRSQGLSLPRDTAVLNLFNCDAATPQNQSGCFWDPYLLNRDRFYEIVSGREAGKNVGLVLQEAGAPPVNQIWVQNRLGETELVFHSNQQYDLPPSAVHEFTGQPNMPITLYLRSCLEVGERTVCEWRPQNVETGVYYALTELATAGSVPGSRLQFVQLEPIVSSTQTGSIVETPPQQICTVLVPALNVRSGPGLEYEIIAKVRGTESEPGSVLVVGRDASGQWLAVDERVAPGGWITGSASFVTCNGDIAALPESEITDGRLAAATPTAPTSTTATANAVEPGETTSDGQPASNSEDATGTAPIATLPITTTIPEGQGLLIVNNGFDQVVRFTLDQRYRVEQGPSEFDLQPGQSISVAVFPGQVAFSASTPWRGLSGNADFFLESKQSRTLWLIFVPDPDGSGEWLLQY
jgi:hypothetical protein